MRTLTVCGRNIADYTIVLNPIPEPCEKTAAEFLQNVIAGSCGVTLPIADSAERGIYIGTREADARVKWDGFRMTTDEKNLYLDGNIPRGTLYAAYDFAEKYLGWRRFAIDCEVLATTGEGVVPAGLNIVDNPCFEVRRNSNFDRLHNPALASSARLNSCLFEDMTAYGGVVFDFIDCHTYQKYCSAAEYGESHPEYFALVNGVRENIPGHQLCLTNPDVLRIVTENVLQELREHPETTLIDFSQEDGPLNCSCEHCAAVDEEEGGTPAGSMIRFVNALADAVAKEFPDVMIQTFAYEYSTKPPKLTKARENVIIRYCTYDACFRHAIDDPCCSINRETTYEEMKGWGRMSHHMSVWNYASNYSCYAAPLPNLRSLREDHRFFADCHAIHVYNEDISPNTYRIAIELDELRSYLISKLLWNPYMTAKEYDNCMNEFLAAYYGRGWEHIRRYIDLLHDTTADRCFTCKEEIDICFIHFETYPKLQGFKPFFRRSYEAKPYQPVYPDHALTGLVGRMEEAMACFECALSMAETDTERERIKEGRMFLQYIKLFCMAHDEFRMSAEEKASYEAECRQYYETKKKFHGYYNIHTTNRGN